MATTAKFRSQEDNAFKKSLQAFREQSSHAPLGSIPAAGELPSHSPAQSVFGPATSTASGAGSVPALVGQVRPTINPATGMAPAASPATAVPAPTGNFEDFAAQYQGTTAQGTPAVSGFRVIRQPGQSPLLTNLTGERLDAALQQPQSITNDQTGQSLTALSGDFTGFRPAQTAAPSAPAGPTDVLGRATYNQAPAAPRTPEQVLGTLRTPSSIAGIGLALNLARSTSQNEINAANRAENLAFRGRKEDRAQQTLDIQAQQAQATTTKALAALAKASKDSSKFSLEPPKPDPNGIPYKDPNTGQMVTPMLPGSVKLGDTKVPFSEADLTSAQDLANRYIARYREAYPNATESPETLFNEFYRQAVLDVIGSRYGTAQ